MPFPAHSASRPEPASAVNPGRALLLGSLLLLIAAAWIAVWRLPESGGLALHHTHGIAGGSPALYALLFIGGWTTMTVAMMLPTSIPVITTFQVIARRRPDVGLLVALVVAGYLAVWSLFGAAVFVIQALVSRAVGMSALLSDHASLSSSLILLLAGGYQFTPLKHRCLDKCRSPLSFVIEHWQGRQERWQALRLGVDHGLFCVGCCWALMLLMFLVGVGHLVWMLLLGVIMATEKNLAWGRRLSAPLGFALIGSGVVLLLATS